MKLALALPYAAGAAEQREIVALARRAEALGYDSLWMPEAYTYDAFMLLAALAVQTERIGLATGVVNLFSRTPALLAQSAATLDALSGGRAILGLGASGPAVVEGWHGLRFEKPVARTREVVDIVRMVLRREPLRYDGNVFQLTGGLRLVNHPVRASIPIVLAALGPKNVALTAEIADGWLPALFSPTKAADVFGPALAEGRARRDADAAPLRVIAPAGVSVGGDERAARDAIRQNVALYVGGMGSREHNFYNQLFRRYGYEAEAAAIQDLYLGGRQREAVALVTDAMVDEIGIVGSPSYAAERLSALAAACVDTLLVSLVDPDPADARRTLALLADCAGVPSAAGAGKIE